MARASILAGPQPIFGIVAVGAGWAISQQWGSDSVFDDCVHNGGGLVVLVSVLGLALAAAGGLYCLHAWRAPERTGRSFLGLVGGLLALLAGFAIMLQLAAGLILPACAA
jgi:hypothetical protein